jgi:hypothetical protein
VFSIQRKCSHSIRRVSISSALITLRWLFIWCRNSSCLPSASFRFYARPLIQPFMTVNPSVRCLLKAILNASSWMEAGSALKAKGAAGLDRNVASAFVLLLGYVPRFVPYCVLEDGEISSSDRSASAPYALFVTGMHGVGCWQVRGAISRGRVGKMHEKCIKTLVLRRKSTESMCNALNIYRGT